MTVALRFLIVRTVSTPGPCLLMLARTKALTPSRRAITIMRCNTSSSAHLSIHSESGKDGDRTMTW